MLEIDPRTRQQTPRRCADQSALDEQSAVVGVLEEHCGQWPKS